MKKHFLLLVAFALFTRVGAQGANVFVTNTNNNLAGSLRQAVQDANAGDTIIFQIPTSDPGYDSASRIFTITLTSGQLVIAKNLTIDGGGQKIRVRRSSAGGIPSFRIFQVTAGNVTIAGLEIANGFTDVEDGGGIRNDGGNLEVVNCTIASNYGLYFGGGIFNAIGTLKVSGCTFIGNSASSGAGIRNNASATVNNSTLTGQHAALQGGGIDNNGQLTLTNSTIKGNIADMSGGGVYASASATTHIRNTIVAGNTVSPPNTSGDVEGPFLSDGYNFIGVVTNLATGFGNSGSHDQTGTTVSPANPNLGPVQDNGGPTQTMRPLTGSFVIDQGSRGLDANNQPINNDQRGQPRPVDLPGVTNAVGGDGSDIGAVEVGLPQTGLTLTVTNIAEHTDGSCTVDDCTLLEAINAANANSDANTITFAPGLTGQIPNTIVGGGLNIVNPVTISGPGARQLAVSGLDISRIFTVAAANVVVSGLTIRNGRVTNADGGAIHNSGGLTLTDCTIFSSYAANTGNGGGVYNSTSGTLGLVRCSITGSVAGQFGGGIYNDGTFTATNCTFTGNAAVRGGGIISRFNNGNSLTTLRNCTITNNTATSTSGGATDGGGGYYAEGGVQQRFVGNSIIAGNINSINPDVRGTITSDGNNLIGSLGQGGAGFSNGVNGDKVGANPGFGAFGNNGGPTDTMAILANSAARDSGNNNLAPATDQRSYFRNGTSDIGAFEFAGAAPLPPAVTTGVATNISSTSATLNATVNPNGFSTSFQFVTDFGFVGAQDAGAGNGNVTFSPNVSGLTPATVYHFRAVASNIVGTTEGSEQTFTTLPGPSPIPSPTPTPTPTPATVLANISTRLRVETGDNVLIGGFIITGTQPKKVIVRAIGTSLPLADKLANPTLELHGPSGLIEANDNWVDSPNKQAIIDSTIPPASDLESAIVQTLPANGTGYTAIVRGVDNGTGIGVVEAYDLDTAANSRLANISTRGFVQTGDNVLIAGTIVVGPALQKVIIRGIGPSLAIPGQMENPTLELRDSNGIILQSNDNWIDSPDKQAIIDSTVPPTNDLESAIIATLSGNSASYTAILRGVNDTTGIAVVEVYALN